MAGRADLGKVKGTDGEGVIAGGTSGQALCKNSAADYDTVWKSVISTVNSAAPDATGNLTLDTGVMGVSYDTANKKITATDGDVVSDIVSAATLKTDMALNNVENKSSATIRSEITSSDIETALGFTPADDDDVISIAEIDALFE